MNATTRAAVLLLALSTACSVDISGPNGPGDGSGGGSGDGSGDGSGGGSGDGDGDGPDAAPLIQRYTLAATPPDQTIDLNASADYVLTLSSENYAGAVELGVAGLPESWTATFTPSAVMTVPDNGEATVTLHVEVPSNAEAATAPFTVTASGGLGDVTASSTMTVADEIVFTIPAGTGNGNHGFSGTLPVRVGTMIKFLNADTTTHRIHADGSISHEPDSLGQGDSYDVEARAGNASFYCHDHGDGSGVGRVQVQ